MGQISLSIPQVGQPNSTEQVKVSNGLTTIQTVINGNLDDTNLFSPNGAVRKLLLQTHGYVSSVSSAGTFILASPTLIASGSGQSSSGIPMWLGDAGYSSQPQDFQVANKTAFGRVRAAIVANAVAPAMTFTFGLYPIGSSVGTSNVIAVTLGTVVSGSTVAVASPGASSITGAESSQFALPAASGAYTLGVVTSAPLASGSAVVMTAEFFGYNT